RNAAVGDQKGANPMLTQISSAAGSIRRPARILGMAFTLFLDVVLFDAALAQELRVMKTDTASVVIEDKNDKNIRDKKIRDEKATSTKVEDKDYADMLKLVDALEERVRQLEAKLAKVEATQTADVAGSVKTVTKADEVTEIKKEIAAIQEEARKNEGAFKFFRDVEFSGVVDGYYSFNNNKVDMFTQGRAFDVRHNAFSLQLAKLTLQKANSKDSPLGFRVDLGLGETVDRVISVSDSSRNDATKHVLQ